MGYTHYFEFKGKEFHDIVLADIRRVVSDYAHILQRNYDDDCEPIIKRNLILFNGIGANGHETFCVTPGEWLFCKTARKHYDLPVCEVLLILKHHYGDAFDLSSDGFWVDEKSLKKVRFDGNWNQALDNVRAKFGYVFDVAPKISHSNGRSCYRLEMRPLRMIDTKVTCPHCQRGTLHIKAEGDGQIFFSFSGKIEQSTEDNVCLFVDCSQCQGLFDINYENELVYWGIDDHVYRDGEWRIVNEE